MAGKTITRRLVARSAWPAVREKIKRAGGLRTCYPQPDKMLAVYATAGLTGAVVAADDLAAYLASDYARIPGKEAIRRSSAWALNPKGAGEKAWRSLGTSEVTDQAPDILRGLGLYRGEVDEGAVPVEAWEVHNFTVPLATSEFDRFVYAVGLRKRRREAAA